MMKFGTRLINALTLSALTGSLMLATSLAAQSAHDPNQPPEHTQPIPNIGVGQNRQEIVESLAQSPRLERAPDARELLLQNQRLNLAFEALQPQRPGVVDAYVLTIALDSDPVFAREAREAGRVLSRRYDGAGRTLTLAGPDGQSDDLPRGTPQAFLTSLAQIASVMDGEEDVLVLYTTSHGIPQGLAYHYGDSGFGVISPQTLKNTLEDLGIKRRILILSACFSGVFVPAVQGDNSAVLTAASAKRSSFGCQAENDWTYYGDALINRALRKPQSLSDAAREANLTVAGWESDKRLLASLPQVSIGSDVDEWLPQLEARMPQTATEPVGRPAVED